MIAYVIAYYLNVPVPVIAICLMLEFIGFLLKTKED